MTVYSLRDFGTLVARHRQVMRHVTLRPETATSAAALRELIDAVYSDTEARVEHG